jgi:uncharacterized protein YciI
VIAALFYRGPAWDDAIGIVGQTGFGGHLEWVERYRDSEDGPIVETAPFHDPTIPVTDELFGLGLLDVESEDAARAVVDEDPLVQAGVLTYRLYTWRGGEGLRRSP